MHCKQKNTRGRGRGLRNGALLPRSGYEKLRNGALCALGTHFLMSNNDCSIFAQGRATYSCKTIYLEYSCELFVPSPDRSRASEDARTALRTTATTHAGAPLPPSPQSQLHAHSSTSNHSPRASTRCAGH